MEENKYEIASEEMSSLLKKTPHTLVRRGNILVLLLLIIFFLTLNRYGSTHTQTLNAYVDHVSINEEDVGSMRYSLIVNNVKDARTKLDSVIEFRFNNNNSTTTQTIFGKIHAVVIRKDSAAVFEVTSNYSPLLRENISGDLKVFRSKKSFFSRAISSILNH